MISRKVEYKVVVTKFIANYFHLIHLTHISLMVNP
jgi:hypothetical protein